MMIPAHEITARAEKIMQLRLGRCSREETVDRTFELAALCKRFCDKWYARGNLVVEWEYRK
jgi:hypothetical protein